MTIKVGRDLIQGDIKKVAYKDVYANIHSWVNAKQFLPLDYDLVMVRLSTEEVTYAWTVGYKWQGVLITPETDVIAWKKKLPPEIMS